MRRPEILNDKKYRLCIELATCSKGNSERYGAILVTPKGEIIGHGFNRAIAHPTFRLERPIKQGYANHAEIEAINDALLIDLPVSRANIYVAGYFPEDKRLFLHRQYTCDRCVKVMSKWDIESVFVPSIHGWVENPIARALVKAESYSGGKGKHENRRQVSQGRYILDHLEVQYLHVPSSSLLLC